jgi:hypothetical protein
VVTLLAQARRRRAEFRRTHAFSAAVEAPSEALEQRVCILEQIIVDQARRITALEAVQAAGDDVNADGRPRLGQWMKLKAAARASGYSESGLRKLARQGRIICDYDGPHLEINISSIPSKVLKVTKVRP